MLKSTEVLYSLDLKVIITNNRSGINHEQDRSISYQNAWRR
ncbi:hypothetical protein SAMN04487897_101623 [Paenibacillus sp. yr247]|nr:hypothetical protein SAMN04487897_101623 [Paenibacillus sp. yr247]